MKFLAILPATMIAAAPAMAGPYVNIEANSGFAGGNYTGTVLDNHIGVDGGSGKYSWYVQGGPSVVSPDGADSVVELSGKVGGSVAATENLSVYGELSFITAADNGYGTKAGLKYRF